MNKTITVDLTEANDFQKTKLSNYRAVKRIKNKQHSHNMQLEQANYTF